MRQMIPVLLPLVLNVAVIAASPAAEPSGDAARGARGFRVCTVCHSLAPGRNMTGPSLAGIWGRKAGTLASFDRYSSALKASGVVWDAKTLDAWLANPAHFIPGNYMTFPGVGGAEARHDLIAYLHAASTGAAPAAATSGGGMGGMMGGMAPHDTDLKTVGPEDQVRAIRYCRDSYFVTTADGKTRAFWERNLRFETDSSASGPRKDAPAIMPAGMEGDRASVIFAAPEEISRAVKPRC
ncbi:MAG: c-type cytochrome [Stellaceae bacterium]